MTHRLYFLEHAQRLFAELFTLEDPFPDIVIPRIIEEHIDGDGFPVRTVAANNYKDVNQFSNNVPGGDVVHTRVGYKRWKIHVEPKGAGNV